MKRRITAETPLPSTQRDPASNARRRHAISRGLPQYGKSAFSLLELLAAVTVLAAILAMLLTMVDRATSIWSANEGTAGEFREARAALSVMCDELACRLSSTNADFFQLNTVLLPANAAPPDRADHLFFISAFPAGAQNPAKNRSDLCAVGYFLAYDKTMTAMGARGSYNLYRYFRPSDETFAEGIRGGRLFEQIATGPGGEEILARNIASFKACAFSVDSKTGARTPFVQSPASPSPDLVEFRIMALSDRAAAKLDSKSAWDSSLPNPRDRHEFSTRIRLSRTP